MSSPIDSHWWGAPTAEEPARALDRSDDPSAGVDGDELAGREQRLALWEQELLQEERRLGNWSAWLQGETPFTPAWSLPAQPVTDALRELYRDRYVSDGDIDTFAAGFGLDSNDTQELLRGEIEEIDIKQIASICEALKCSPYDLWGPDEARTILHAYGPDRWPRYIEPLDAGRDRYTDDTFLRRRIGQQASELLVALDAAGSLGPRGWPAAHTDVLVTCYREDGILRVDDAGGVTPVNDGLERASEAEEYHMVFRQIEPSRWMTFTVSGDALVAGVPTGYDAEPALADAATLLRKEPALHETAMVRFANRANSDVQWLGYDRETGTWQTWDDPRDFFPGDPAQVLAGLDTDDRHSLTLPSYDETQVVSHDASRGVDL